MTAEAYTQLSRFTDPGERAPMLQALPSSVDEVCELAEHLTIHRNLLGYYRLDPQTAQTMRSVWPPRLPDALAALAELEPGNLHDPRPPERRIVGGCVLESHILAGLLRWQGIPTRVRAGYFQGIRADGEHIVRFWRRALAARGIGAELCERDPDRWREGVDTLTRRRNEVDHHIEHWVCEYWDEDTGAWWILDANRTFLAAHSNLDVGFQLPPEHFEHAAQAWRRLRSEGVDPEQYEEEPQDGHSRIRTQLLWDFYGLLNYDLAGVGDSDEARAFVTEQTYDGTPAEELAALDALAELLSEDPDLGELSDFYFATDLLRTASAETDPYSVVSGAR